MNWKRIRIVASCCLLALSAFFYLAEPYNSPQYAPTAVARPLTPHPPYRLWIAVRVRDPRVYKNGQRLTLKYDAPIVPIPGSCGPYALYTVLENQDAGVPYYEVCRQMALGRFPYPDARDLTRAVKPWLPAKLGLLGTPEDVAQHVASGNPAIVITTLGETQHAVVVTGYKTDDAGSYSEWEIIDSALGAYGPKTLDHQRFMEIWFSTRLPPGLYTSPAF